MIDVKNDKLSLQLGDEKVEFHLPQSMANLTLNDTCCRVDVLEMVLHREAMICHSMDDLLEAILIGRKVNAARAEERQEYAIHLNASIAYTPRKCPQGGS